MAKAIMVQGTASNVGKSLLVAGLCRIFMQDGYRVAPFKSQNMALNSFITEDKLELGRAQAMQAEAAGIPPSVLMNPILLKPTGDVGSQVIVRGEVRGDMDAEAYYATKHALRAEVQAAYDELAAGVDIVVIEGAGSPAEINLNKDDFVNMGMARMADAPVLLAGDIDRGGVFASLYGTVQLMEPEDKVRIKGIIINKFRGDVNLLRPGLADLERLCGAPVLGVVPHVHHELEEEDSLASALQVAGHEKPVDVAVLRLPQLSNFTDFDALAHQPALGVRYVGKAEALGRPDLVILPGSKNTMGDLSWLRETGLARAVLALAGEGTPVLGICGGYQMLGKTVSDPAGVEGGGAMEGLGLLGVETVFGSDKARTRVTGHVGTLDGFFSCLAGCRFDGYEIHMGRSSPVGQGAPFAHLSEAGGPPRPDGWADGNVMGSYVHGLFDSGEIPARLAATLLMRRGLPAAAAAPVDHKAAKEKQYNLWAATLRDVLDMESIYTILGLKGANT